MYPSLYQELEAGSPARPPQPAALLGMKFRDRELPKTPMEATPSSTLSTPPDSATSTSILSPTPFCLEVEGRPWYRRVDRKKAEELVRKGEGRKNSRMEVWKDGGKEGCRKKK